MDTFTLGITVIIYFLVVSYLGYLGYKRTKSAKDYLLAGRQTNPVVMAISYGATFISTSAIVGFGGMAANFGMGLIWLTVLNMLFGIIIAFIFFGRKTRRIGHRLDAHTFPELLGRRFLSKNIQVMSGSIIFIGMPLYAAVVLIGGARFMETIFGIDYGLALTIFTIITSAYVIAGGLKGIMYTDALQGGIMFVSMLFLLIGTYRSLGMGFAGANQELSNMASMVPEKLHAMGHLGWTSMPAFGSPWWWTLVSTLVVGVGIGVLAQPQLAVRFMTVKSDRELNRAVFIGTIFIFTMTGFIFTVGAISNLFFYQKTGQLAITAAGGNIDKVIPVFISQAFPAWFVVLFMLSLLSAAMSTLSGQFHAMGTSIGHDVYERTVPTATKTTLITRIGITISIIISAVIGYSLPEGTIARGTVIFFGLCAATFLPTYFAALYWKGATKSGVKWSMLIGALLSVLGILFLHKAEAEPIGLCNAIFGKPFLIDAHPWKFVDPIIYSTPISVVVLIVVSLVTKKLPKEHLDKINI